MNDKRKIIAIFIIVAIVAALAAVATFFVIKSAKKEARGSSQMTETATEDSSDKEDPQHTGGNAGSMSATSDDGASADETQILSASSVAENSKLTFGIDVSKYQGTIKWDKVAAGGIDFRRGFKKSGVPAELVRGAAAKMLEFELAATLRDQIIELRGK